ncbi:MAG TPA: porin family protein [Chitinophagaceae bacterium]|nr:porin family protein [Chitinophagaceae bacterium]
MKKISLFISAALLSIAALAQKHPPILGVKGGINLSSWNVDGAFQDQIDSRLGFHFGLIAHTHITDQVALQPELQFSSQGAKQNAGNGQDYVYRMNYINVPVMIQYMFDNGFRIEAGPQLGFLVGAKDVAPDGGEVTSTDDYKTVDAGVGLGINYLTYSGIGIGARYIFGLSNINDIGINKTQNRNLQLSLFYLLDKNHKRKSR